MNYLRTTRMCENVFVWDLLFISQFCQTTKFDIIKLVCVKMATRVLRVAVLLFLLHFCTYVDTSIVLRSLKQMP